MSQASARPPRVAIVGGGITGLAAALRLHDAPQAVDWRLLEASPRLGGVLETIEIEGYRLELSADNFLTREPDATQLCRRLGIAEDLLPTDAARRRALVVNRGQVLRVPEGFVLMSPQKAWPIMSSPLLSAPGKARLAAEFFVPARRDEQDESVASFARRRLGRETYERIVQPLVAGIYTADPERLSMQATMGQFVKQERDYGSLTRAALAGRQTNSKDRRESGARYSQFVAPRGGMQQMIDALATQLPGDRIQTGVAIQSAMRHDNRWRLTDATGEHQGDFDELIITIPAPSAAKLLASHDAELATLLQRIEYAGCSVVCLGLQERQIHKPIEGFGFVVPAIEGRRLIAASFASYKFPDRAPEGRLLARVFVGGALQPELAELDDAELTSIACQELADLVGLQGTPEFARVARWPNRMPQYHLGHVDLVDAIQQRADEVGIELAGAAYRGVGIPQCIRSGAAAAQRVLDRWTASAAQS